jgi:molybdopterin synthase sulfur carrier subunit
MRDLIPDQPVVCIPGKTVRDVIEQLEQKYPGAKDRLCSGEKLKPGIAVTVDGAISPLGLRQPLGADAELHFLPAIGGG